MRIDSISSSPDRAGRFLIKFQSGAVMRVYRQTIEDFALYPGLELTAAQWASLQESAGAYSAKMRAVRIVSASSVSRKTLEQRLVQKGEDARQAKEAVEWMENLNLLDDRQTAAQIVSRCISKGYGASRAKQALYEKQIPKELWEEALEDYPDQSEYILKFLRSKLPCDADARQTKRAVDALMRRGHSYGVIRRVLEQMGTDTEEFPEENSWLK